MYNVYWANFQSTVKKCTYDVLPLQRSTTGDTEFKNRQCTYNVPLRGFRANIGVVESNKYYMFWVCLCNLKYTKRNAHAPYCHLWPTWPFHIFQRYHINGTIFGERKLIEHKMCVLIFSATYIGNISHSKKNWAGYAQKCVLVFM
jgi:hypothetical protein